MPVETQNVTPITLAQLSQRIKGLLNSPTLRGVWVEAETSSFSVKRHCYMELLQKDVNTGNSVAKMKACIWANRFASLNAKFKNVTGKDLASNMKVMVLLSVTYSEQYGLSAVIEDINPEFTLGDAARRRQEILDRLTKEGILEKNKSVPVPLVPQRIAVISAVGAAGWGDFLKHLSEKSAPYHLVNYPCLFSATMQGANAAPTILAAFDRVERHLELFDLVVVIRGGGSTDDLSCFDNYDIARRIALFPKPVVVGIGHERDVTVLDYVAGVRVKTPTAAAEFIVQCGVNQLAFLSEVSNAVVRTARDHIARSNEQLGYFASTVPLACKMVIDKNKALLNGYVQTIPLKVSKRIDNERSALQRAQLQVTSAASQLLMKAKMRQEYLSDMVETLSPISTLKRGYTLTMSDGKIVTSTSQVTPGHTITTHFADGKTVSEVKNVIRK